VNKNKKLHAVSLRTQKPHAAFAQALYFVDDDHVYDMSSNKKAHTQVQDVVVNQSGKHLKL
jgi:hypothetical protein